MSDLRLSLIRAIQRAYPKGTPLGIAFSGGLDSLTGVLAARAAGFEFRLYTFELERLRSQETHRAVAIARRFGWRLDIVTIPAQHLADDFMRLIVQDGCRTKVQAEVTYGCRYLFPAIAERDIVMCMNADDYYGNGKRVILEQVELKRKGLSQDELKTAFDGSRARQIARVHDLDSGDTWGFAVRVAGRCGKTLMDPYLDASVSDVLFSYNHQQLSPASKPIIRRAFAEDLASLDERLIVRGVGMQTGARVNERFATLLDDPRINRFRCRTVLHLCQAFSRAATDEPDRFGAEVASLGAPPSPHVRRSHDAYSRYYMRDVGRASNLRRFTCVTTFAGGGGSSIGYKLAGGSILAANEFVPEASRTYTRNFPATHVEPTEIRQLLVTDRLQAFLTHCGIRIGEIDIVDGSPPCSEFSIAGNGVGDQEIPKRYSDVTQSGIATLPFAFRTFVHRLRPRIFVMENVPNLASARNSDILNRLLGRLRFDEEERRYFVHFSILSASDFGVPQRRQRLFAIGVRADVAASVGIGSDEEILNLFPMPTHGLITVRASFDGLSQSKRDLDPWIKSCRASGLLATLQQLPKSPSKLSRIPNATTNFTLTRTSWDLPAPTLTVTSQQPNGMAGAIHPSENRKFTLPELKRLFSLPEDYVLTGTVAQAAERICRMVPPPLTKAIAESLYTKVLLPYREAMREL